MTIEKIKKILDNHNVQYVVNDACIYAKFVWTWHDKGFVRSACSYENVTHCSFEDLLTLLGY